MKLTIETEKESEGRWITEVMEHPGVLVYGETREKAIEKVIVLAYRDIAFRIEHGEAPVDFREVSFREAA